MFAGNFVKVKICSTNFEHILVTGSSRWRHECNAKLGHKRGTCRAAQVTIRGTHHSTAICGSAYSVTAKIAGRNAKFAQNLLENCTEYVLKSRAICASCAQIELKNPPKIGKNCQKLACKCFYGCDKVFYKTDTKQCLACAHIFALLDLFHVLAR